MRVTLDALLVLDAIDNAGSFAAGAMQLFRVPSAVSYTIHKLEQDLGVAIFDRTHHRAKLTEAGAQLLKDGRALIRLAADLERKVKDVGAGREARLSIAVGDAVTQCEVYSLLRSFYAVPGHQSTRLKITTEAQATCWETLLAGRSDLVIGAPEPGPDVAGFCTQALGEVALSLVVPCEHPLARAEEPLSSRSFSQYPMIRQASWPFYERFEHSTDEFIIVDDYGSEADAIRHGLGIGYLPAHLVKEDVAAGRLVAKAVAESPTLKLAVAWRTTGTGKGLEWLVEQLREPAIQARLISHSP